MIEIDDETTQDIRAGFLADMRVVSQRPSFVEEMLAELRADEQKGAAANSHTRANSRRPRKPTLAGALREAAKAGQHLAGAVIEDGKIELKFGDRVPADNNDNEVESWIRDHAH